MNKEMERIKRDKRLIREMIDASCELARKKGRHDLEPGCNCISCINKRKRILENSGLNNPDEWKYTL
jgi:hypothetical protein